MGVKIKTGKPKKSPHTRAFFMTQSNPPNKKQQNKDRMRSPRGQSAGASTPRPTAPSVIYPLAVKAKYTLRGLDGPTASRNQPDLYGGFAPPDPRAHWRITPAPGIKSNAPSSSGRLSARWIARHPYRQPSGSGQPCFPQCRAAGPSG